MCTPATEPARTLTTTRHQSLVAWQGPVPAVEDCTFRMLEPREIQAAMAFRAAYRVRGTRREQVRPAARIRSYTVPAFPPSPAFRSSTPRSTHPEPASASDRCW